MKTAEETVTEIEKTIELLLQQIKDVPGNFYKFEMNMGTIQALVNLRTFVLGPAVNTNPNWTPAGDEWLSMQAKTVAERGEFLCKDGLPHALVEDSFNKPPGVRCTKCNWWFLA